MWYPTWSWGMWQTFLVELAAVLVAIPVVTYLFLSYIHRRTD